MTEAPQTAAVADRPAIGRTLTRVLIEHAPPLVVAVLILPFIIAYGQVWPWRPSTIDLQVYLYAVNDMLAGKDIYLTQTPFWHLYFIYPPIAAVLMVPLAIGPYWMWQLIWTAVLIWSQQSVLRRCGVPRGWKLALVGIALVVAVEPIRTTLGYGQINTVLMAFVVADLLPDRPGEKRMMPRGTLIGLAAAIKLTPALFVVFCFLLGKRRIAWTSIASFAGFTLVGAIFQWHQTFAFWGGLAGGKTRTASPIYVGNQSLLGVFDRLAGSSVATTLIGMAAAAVVALLSAIVGAHWWRRDEPVFAIGLVGLATCLASPLSWTHHYVWIVPMGIAVLTSRQLPRWARGVGQAWVLWVCVCLPLAVLPYGGNKELHYTFFQQIIANVGPILGVVLLAGLAIQLISSSRSRVSQPVGAG